MIRKNADNTLKNERKVLMQVRIVFAVSRGNRPRDDENKVLIVSTLLLVFLRAPVAGFALKRDELMRLQIK